MEKSSHELREQARMLVRKLGLIERAGVECCGVTLPQCHAVVEIGRQGSLSLNSLAELLGLDKSTVSKTVDKLVAGGLLVRDADPEDRRYVVLTLTEQGAVFYHSIEARMEGYFSLALQAIPEDKRAQVLESLALLAKALPGSACCEE